MRETFECEVFVRDMPAAQVLDAYWRLERWPEVAPHVMAIDLLHHDDTAQVLIMTVSTRGRIDSFKSVRVKERNIIRYIQPQPPRILHHHHGSWTFEAAPGGTRVISRHAIEVDVPTAYRVLRDQQQTDIESDEAVRAAIVNLIRNNSLQTMNALRQRLEQGGSYATAARA